MSAKDEQYFPSALEGISDSWVRVFEEGGVFVGLGRGRQETSNETTNVLLSPESCRRMAMLLLRLADEAS